MPTPEGAQGSATGSLPTDRPPVVRYLGALLIVAVALGVSALGYRALSPSIFLLLYPAVTVAAWFGGLGPAIAASILAVVGANIWLLAPVGGLSLRLEDLERLGAFLAISLLVSALTASEQAARRRAQARADENAELARRLQDQQAELEQQLEESQQLQEELEEQQVLLTEAHALTERARAEAEAANRAKTEFLAVMSHELRTPLNAIGGYTQLLELGIHGQLTPAQKQDLQRIQRSALHLLSLINQILNFAKLDAGQVHLEPGRVRVADALADLEALVAPQVQAKGIAFQRELPAADVVVWCDPEKLQQILLNLLSNAIKFTPAGGTVTVSTETEGGFAFIRVEDTGPGIPPEKLEHIFEPFVQLDRGLTSRQEGAGLGLAISRELARAMAGDLTAEPAPGGGARFRLRLPLADDARKSA